MTFVAKDFFATSAQGPIHNTSCKNRYRIICLFPLRDLHSTQFFFPSSRTFFLFLFPLGLHTEEPAMVIRRYVFFITNIHPYQQPTVLPQLRPIT